MEVLVAATIMLALSLALFWALVYAGAFQRKHDAASDGSRECAVALSHLEERLRIGRVEEPVAGQTSNTLSYRFVPRDSSGNFVVQGGGLTQWEGPVTIHLQAEPSTGTQMLVSDEVVDPDDGSLLLPKQVLARLGPMGDVSFLRVSDRRLRITVVAQQDRPQDVTRSYKCVRVLEVYLQNQGP